MGVLEEIKERLSIFKNVYDIIRIIDPVNKKAIILKYNDIEIIKNNCFDLLKNDEICKNCISMRSYMNGDTFSKLEYSNGKMFFIISIPIKFHEKDYVLEMLKEVSKDYCNIDGKGDLKDLIDILNKKVITDDLTNVYNRRYLSERLPIDINNSMKIKKPLSVAIADVDSFKKVNDNYGHVMGDIVLKGTSKIIKDCLSNSDYWVGRYGGDEFLIVLNNTDRENAFKIIEDIKEKVVRHKFTYNDKSINITLSFGIYTVNKPISFNAVIEKLDENLYEAKKNGKNRITG